MTETFDPYYRWLGIRDPQRPPNHYRLLGLEPFESDADVIAAGADRQMAFVRTFQTGPHADLSQRILNELAIARLCLLNPQRRAAYDAELRRTFAALGPADSGILRGDAGSGVGLGSGVGSAISGGSGIGAGTGSGVSGAGGAPPAIATAAPPAAPAIKVAPAASLAGVDPAKHAARRKLYRQLGLIWFAVLTVIVLLLLMNRVQWGPNPPAAPSDDPDADPPNQTAATVDLGATLAGRSGASTGEAVAGPGELTPAGTLAGHQISVWSLSLSADAEILFSGSADESARTWTTHNDEPDRLIEAHEAIVQAAAIAPDGQYAATADVEGRAYLWKLDRAEPLFEHKFSPVANVLAFSPDGLKVAAGLSDGTVALWNVGTGEFAAPIKVFDGKILALAWYDDRRFLAAGVNPEIRLLHADGPVERGYPVLSGSVFALAASAKEKRFVSAGQDGTLTQWAIDSGSPVRTLEGHEGPVRAASLTADGRGLVSGGEDGTVRFWDLATGREVARSAKPTAPRAAIVRVLTAVVAPDGSRAYSGGTEPLIRAWKLPPLPPAGR